jgi:hypothetical protein
LVLPLIFKLKGVTTGFSITDGQGHAVSHLTLDESADWTRRILVGAAREMLKTPLEAGITQLLEKVALADPSAARALVAWAVGASASTERSLPERWQAGRICDDDFVWGLVSASLEGYYVLVPTANETGKDLTFILLHEDALPARGSVPFPIGSASSYHAHVELPTGVAFRRGIQFVVPEGLTPPSPRDALLPLYYRGQPPWSNAEWLQAWRSVRLGSGGLKWPARLIALGTLGVFVAGLSLRLVGAKPAISSAPLLIIAITLAATVALQRSDWEIQRAVSQSAVYSLTLVVGAAAIGAGALAVSWPHIDVVILGFDLGWRAVVWSVGGLMAAVAAILTSIAWMRDR